MKWVVAIALGIAVLWALKGKNDGVLYEDNYPAAEAQMTNFGQAIDNFNMVNKRLPATLYELEETSDRNPHPFVQKITTDPWGNEYGYRVVDRNTFEIRSNGEDGLQDTEDDVVFPARDG